MLRPTADRRTFLGALAAPFLVATKGINRGRPRASTTAGMVEGLYEQGICVFRGIPYAASTGGDNRFRPPQPPAPWTGVRDCSRSGFSAPQQVHVSRERAAFAAVEEISEDCLTLNVFTPEPRDGARRPVMVWFHGGGWRTGAGSAPALQGHGLARDGDVVLVTVNHRLDVLGFLQIADGDERFLDAGNLGVLDMVCALQWVRDNAAAMGADPGNVTIFGQSGGGSKVAALLACEKAAGLFHKAIAMSCSGCLRFAEPAEGAAIARKVAAKLGLERLTGPILQTVPMATLIAAAESGCRPMLDGRTFSRHPFDPDASPLSRNIPLLAGNVANETRLTLLAGGMKNFAIEKAEAVRRIARFLAISGIEAETIYQAYALQYPHDSAALILAAVTGDYTYVRNTRRMADLQARHALVHTYMFMHRSPILSGLLGAPHESDVPYIFGTIAAAESIIGREGQALALSQMMIRTWTAFARSGTPGHPLLQSWPIHSPGSNLAMLLDLAPRFGPVPGQRARSQLDRLPWYEYSRSVDYNRD
ncbi:Carboxylesterase (plasmid) [Sphingobium sp. EP60837]|nr:Carboxylesterase [Sphingobium sp. EP60837]